MFSKDNSSLISGLLAWYDTVAEWCGPHAPAPVNNNDSGDTRQLFPPAADAQYPSYKIKEFPATTIVRLPFGTNTNARLRMTLQKFAWRAPFFFFAESNFCTSLAIRGAGNCTRSATFCRPQWAGAGGAEHRRLFRATSYFGLGRSRGR